MSHLRPVGVFPYDPDRTFTPVDAPKEQLSACTPPGSDPGVIVQSSCHGHDHRVLMDALKSGGGRLRGVALIGESTTRAEIEELHRAGVRAFRLNFLPICGLRPPAPRSDSVLERVDGLGWSAHSTSGVMRSPHWRTRSALPRRWSTHGARRLAAGRDGPALRSLRALLTPGTCG